MPQSEVKIKPRTVKAGSVNEPAVVSEPDPVVAPEAPKIKRVCGNCEAWRPNGSNPVFGQCLLSAKSMQAPMMTTDLTSCTHWKLADLQKLSSRADGHPE